MLRDHLLAFDDYLQPHGSIQPVLRSSDALASRLAKHDGFVMHAIASDGGGAPGKLTVYLEHSGNGQHWAPKQATPEIANWTLNPNASTSVMAYDTGDLPTLNFARLVVSCDGPKAQRVRVRIYMSLRDLDGDLRWRPTKHKHHHAEDPDLDVIAETGRIDAKIHTHGPERGGASNRPSTRD